MDPTTEDRRADSRLRRQVAGCLLGGAVGDALGAPVAAMDVPEITRRYGDAGIVGMETAYGRPGAVTDHTRMALFTAEGLILSKVRPEYGFGALAATSIYHACLRWLYTQDAGRQSQLIDVHGTCALIDGILTGHRELFSRRKPDPVCLDALRSGRMGTRDQPVNASRGCGGLMRAAPVGLVCADAKEAFDLGCAAAAITHSHPDGYLPAGFLSAAVSKILAGEPLQAAVVAANGLLKQRAGHLPCLRAIEIAIKGCRCRQPLPETVDGPGSGDTAIDTLVIALHAALAAGGDFRRGVLRAVNHSGKSDAIGTIAGQIMGACCGSEAIPKPWLSVLELKEVIVEIADDLFHQAMETSG